MKLVKNPVFWQWFEDHAVPRLDGGLYHLRRTDTFRKIFEYLDKRDEPVGILETGCIEDDDNWIGNGQSTILFDNYVAYRGDGSWVRSCDTNPSSVDCAKTNTSKHTRVELCDSVTFLRNCANVHLTPVDLVYLDASFLDWTHPLANQVHHYNELMAILPVLRPDTLVVVDDTQALADAYPTVRIDGKGGLIARYAQEVGAEMVFSHYQTGWVGLTNRVYRGVETLEQLVMRARAHAEKRQFAQASSLYQTILVNSAPPWTGRMRIARGEAMMFFAKMAIDHKRLGTAMDWYRDAIEVDPGAADYRDDLVRRVLLPMDHLKMARTEARKTVRMDPAWARAWGTLGVIEQELGHQEKAIAAYSKALELAPDDLDQVMNRASLAIDTEEYGLVEELCGHAMKTDREGDAYHCLAMVAHRREQYEHAVELYDLALKAGVRDRGLCQWNKSTSLQAIGRYKEGWAAHEFRAIAKANPILSLPCKRFNRPMWQGEPPPAIIHVHAEAGAGDNIAMLRYLPMLAARGYTVRYECQEGFEDLCRRSFPEVEIVPQAVDYPGALGIQPFDYHIPIGSLPYVFGTDIDTVPQAVPYLKADPDLVRRMESRLPVRHLRKIGLCWSSGIRREMGVWMTKYGLNKSMQGRDLLPLLDIYKNHGNLFVNLQVGPERHDLDPQLLDALPEEPTWDETAALIENLDLVITVDTGVAHMAGALGKPVWIMMHRQGSWHFMVEGYGWDTASPWYPTARLFRQSKRGDWGPVVKAINDALREPVAEAAE